MANMFSDLKCQNVKWLEKSRRKFTPEEIEEITEAVVVPTQYGLSARFRRKNGYLCFIVLAQTATLGVGEYVDMHKAEVITLSKQGENDIIRLQI